MSDHAREKALLLSEIETWKAACEHLKADLDASRASGEQLRTEHEALKAKLDELKVATNCCDDHSYGFTNECVWCLACRQKDEVEGLTEALLRTDEAVGISRDNYPIAVEAFSGFRR